MVDSLQGEEDCFAMQYAIFFNDLPPYPGAYAHRGGGSRDGAMREHSVCYNLLKNLCLPKTYPRKEGEGGGEREAQGTDRRP